jgi:hypothetical protein
MLQIMVPLAPTLFLTPTPILLEGGSSIALTHQSTKHGTA